MTTSRRTFSLFVFACAAGSAVLYLAFGTLSAFLAADDFGWLGNALVVDWKTWFVAAGRTHFYRPVVEVWFAALTPVCGYSPKCYHAFSLTAHTANVALFCVLVRRVSGSVRCAVVAAAIFGALPGYVEAVVWISASTILLAAFFWLLSAHVSITAAERNSLVLWTVAAVLWGLAVFSHESAASLLLVLPALLPSGLPFSKTSRSLLRMALPFAAVASVFTAAVIVVNSHNYVFVDGHYRMGEHLAKHALDYIAALYVGPHRSGWNLLGIVLVVLAACLGGRVGWRPTVWMLATLLPYLPFTWGNVSRYLYMPAMGFSFLIATAILSIENRAATKWMRWGHVIHDGAMLLVLVVVARFAVFAKGAVLERYDWMQAYRDYSAVVLSLPRSQNVDDPIIVPMPTDSRVEAPYVASAARWVLHRPAADVRIAPAATIER